MSTALDDRIMIGVESTYGTAVTPTRSYPWLSGTKTSWLPRWRESAGVVTGSGRRSMLASRRFLATGQGEVTLKVELESKGAAMLLHLGMGTSTVTAITGGSLILIHPGLSSTVMPSATIQIVKVRNDGTEIVETFAGCTASKLTIEQPGDDIATVEVVFDARTFTTATAAATPAYAATPTLYDYIHDSIGYGGTLTVPTTTALATGLTPFVSFTSWKLEIDQALAKDRWQINAGLRAQPLAGMPDIKFSGDVELNDLTIYTPLTAGTISPWYSTHSTAVVVGSGVEQFQVVIPKLALTSDLPDIGGLGDVVKLSVEADVRNDGTNRDVYVVYRTLDTAL